MVMSLWPRFFGPLCMYGMVSVRLSVPSIDRCNSVRGFAAVGPASAADRRYRSITARPVPSSNCEQCHVVSWRMKLNTDLFKFKFVE